MTIVVLNMLKSYCRYEYDKLLIDELIDENKSVYHSPFSNPLDDIYITYYWTYGSMLEQDIPIAEKAMKEKNYKLWDDCRIVYPDNLPRYACLYLPNIDDSIQIEITPFTWALVDEFDCENG